MGIIYLHRQDVPEEKRPDKKIRKEVFQRNRGLEATDASSYGIDLRGCQFHISTTFTLIFHAF